MEPNPLAALAPPPEELKISNVAHGRGTVSVVGLLTTILTRTGRYRRSRRRRPRRCTFGTFARGRAQHLVSTQYREMCDGPDVIWALRANPSQHAGYMRALLDPRRNALATTHRSRAGDRRGPVELASCSRRRSQRKVAHELCEALGRF